MTYTPEQIDKAIKATRLKFFRSAILAMIMGATALYLISKNPQTDHSVSLFLFLGFMTGFGIAGIILPQGFRAQLYK